MPFYPKKSLGQNFLIDETVLNKIVDFSKIENQEVLEIGPGTGNLTEKILLKKPSKFYVIEKDNNLSTLLQNKFGNHINIINKDVLDVNENTLSENKLLVIGNLPYNISTEILSKWILNLKNNFWFSNLILMFQKEVADRIISNFNNSNYGRLSILVNWKLNVSKIVDVNPKCFYPIPKVESTVLNFFPKPSFFVIKDPKNLELITRTFFSERRKMIKKPLNKLFSNASEICKKLNIDNNLRPQNLEPEMYYNLTRELEKLRG